MSAGAVANPEPQQGRPTIDWSTYKPLNAGSSAAAAPQPSAPTIDWGTYKPLPGKPQVVPAPAPPKATGDLFANAPASDIDMSKVAGAVLGTPSLRQMPAPAAPPDLYRPPLQVSAAPPPTLGERLRSDVANSVVGHSLASNLPKVADALHLQPTETVNSPTYEDHKTSLPDVTAELPAWMTRPLQPTQQEQQDRVMDMLHLPDAQRQQIRAREQQQQQQFSANHPVAAGVMEGVDETARGMTSPFNAALLLAAPESKVLGAIFTLQAAHGVYDSEEAARKAFREGNNKEAAKAWTTAAINAGLIAAPHLMHGHSPEAGATEPQSSATPEKPVLHDTDDVEALRASAERQAPKIGDAVAAATEGVPGAKVEAVRDAKDADRIEDKADRQGVAPSQIADIAAAKVTVPDQAAADQVLANLHEQLPVETAEGTVDGEAQKNGVRQVQAVVNTEGAAPGEPVKRAEVLLQTPEMNEATDATHDDYRKAQELRANGDEAGAKALEAKIEEQHEAANAAARERQADTEPKYKFGSTQANLPKDSEAHAAVMGMQSRIPDTDLAGDGKDIDDPHVTVRYGLKNGITPELRRFIESQSPFEAKLGKTTSFPPTENSDGAAPIIAPVESPELHRINAEIERQGQFEPSSFPEYKPHVTVAYVRPELAQKYSGLADADGKTFAINSIAVSDRNGTKTEIPLRGDSTREEQVVKPDAERGVEGVRMPVANLPRPAAALPERAAVEGEPARAPVPPTGRGEGTAGAERQPQLATPPRPPFVKGDAVEVRGADGQWQPGTLEYYSPGYNGAPSARRVRLQDGSVLKNVPAAEMRAASDAGKAPGEVVSPAARGGPDAGVKADVGLDFDGTLAKSTGTNELGAALPERIASVKKMLAEGKSVEIVTRRVENDPTGAEARRIQDWLEQQGLPRLPVTDQKTASVLYDDNVVHAPTDADTPLGEPNAERDAAKPVGAGADGADAARVRSDVAHPESSGASGTGAPTGNGEQSKPGQLDQADVSARERSGDAGVERNDDGAGEAADQLNTENEENDARKADRDKDLDAAGSRSLIENAARHKSKVEEVAGRKALVLDADGEGVWHRLFRKVANLGAGETWLGMTLDKTGVDRAVNFLKAQVANVKGGLSVDVGAAEGYQRMARALEAARGEDGGVSVLRGDYRADTAREEATHQWQREHGLNKSQALAEVAERPEFDRAITKLREMGYDVMPQELAAEAMAKAMAGDPEFSLTDEQREEMVRSFLTAAVEEKGADILRSVPETDPRLTSVIKELQRGYDYGEQYDQRNEGRGEQATRDGDRQAGRGIREGDARPRNDTRGQERADAGAERGVPEERPQEDQLTKGRAPKPPDSMLQRKTETGSEEPVFQRYKESPLERTREAWISHDNEQLDALDALMERLQRGEEDEQTRRQLEGVDDLVKSFERVAPRNATEERLMKKSQEIRDQSLKEESSKRRKDGMQWLAKQNAEADARRRNANGKTEGPLQQTPSALSRLRERIEEKPKAPVPPKDRLAAQVKASAKAAVEDTSKALTIARDAMKSAWQGLRDMRKPPSDVPPEERPTSGYMQAYGRYEEAKYRAARDHQKTAEALRERAPDPLTQEAMTNWIQARGDNAKLKFWAEHSKEPYKAGYERAMKLTPEEKSIAEDFKRYYDEQEREAKHAGLLGLGKSDYMMQIYEADRNGTQTLVDTSKLNDNPSIFKPSTYRNYFEAESAGMVPRNKQIGWLTGRYDELMGEAVRTRAMLGDALGTREKDGRPSLILRRDGTVMQVGPENEPYLMHHEHADDGSDPDRRDYEMVPHPVMRQWLWQSKDLGLDDLTRKQLQQFQSADGIAMRGDIYAHPDVVKHLSNMLGKSAVRATAWGRVPLAVSQFAKDLMFTFAGTHEAITSTTALMEGQPPINLDNVKKIATLKGWANPLDMDDTLLDVDHGPDAKIKQLGVRNGLTLLDIAQEEGWSEGGMMNGAMKYLGPPGRLMVDYKNFLFRNVMPKIKMKMFIERYKVDAKRYKGEKTADEIAENTARQVNSMVGGINWQRMGVSKTAVDLARLALLAPDFQYGAVSSITQALKPGGRQQLMVFARTAMIVYGTARIINAIANDGDAKWDKEDAFRLVVNGKHYGIRTRIGDAWEMAQDPRLYIMHRLNPLFSRTLLEAVTHKDEYGRAKTGTGIAKDAVTNMLPIALAPLLKNEDMDWQQTFLSSDGIQTGKYYTPTETLAHKLRIGHMPQGGDDAEEDEAKQELSREHRHLKEKLRDGSMSTSDLWNEVKAGKLTAHDAQTIHRAAMMTPLQEDTQALSLAEAMQVYEKATPAERAQLHHLILAKASKTYKRHPEEAKTMVPKVRELLAQK